MFHNPFNHLTGPALLILSWVSTDKVFVALIPTIPATIYYCVATYVLWKNRNK